jgi:hypothetical protein
MELSQCPLDGTDLEVEYMAGGSILLSCPACEAVWERHGAWIGRVREPDPDKARKAREANGRTDAAFTIDGPQ